MKFSSCFRHWSVWRAARVITSLFILMVVAYYLVVSFDNTTNSTNQNASNWPFVKGVLSGEGVPADSGFAWRFIDATWCFNERDQLERIALHGLHQRRDAGRPHSLGRAWCRHEVRQVSALAPRAPESCEPIGFEHAE